MPLLFTEESRTIAAVGRDKTLAAHNYYRIERSLFYPMSSRIALVCSASFSGVDNQDEWLCAQTHPLHTDYMLVARECLRMPLNLMRALSML